MNTTGASGVTARNLQAAPDLILASISLTCYIVISHMPDRKEAGGWVRIPVLLLLLSLS